MKILVGHNWQEGFLDYFRSNFDYRVQVLAFKNLEKINDLYFVRPYRLHLIWNYFREVGIMQLFRKVLSRTQEKWRNEKYISCGIGKIIESADESIFPVNQLVVFIAPCHPACVERIVLSAAFMMKINFEMLPQIIDEKRILYCNSSAGDAFGISFWKVWEGWSPYAGKSIEALKESDGKKIVNYFIDKSKNDFKQLLIDKKRTAVFEVNSYVRHKHLNGKKRAVLFGYGNYAKTMILPHIKNFLSVEYIHEIDPTQIPRGALAKYQWNTAPEFNANEEYDVCFIAGFHHMHASLAISALKQGSSAVIEKPILVNREQLDSLLEIMKGSKGQLFVCFQKRWSIFNEMALNDLNVKKGEPISYYCIVYEVPLPKLHWYRWPNSKSRIISNGCHWIDHFLYLNDFCDVKSLSLARAKDGTLNCSVELANGAFFTMVLTDAGSDRIGVQDYVELRANGVTIKIVNGSQYLSENSTKILRSKKINKIKSYIEMYRQIGLKISRGEEGESIRSVQSSAGLILDMEDMLKQIERDETNNPIALNKS